MERQILIFLLLGLLLHISTCITTDLCKYHSSSIPNNAAIHLEYSVTHEANNCRTENSVLIIMLKDMKLKPDGGNECYGSLRISKLLGNTDLCDSRTGDCFIFANKTIPRQINIDGCSKIMPYYKKEVFPFTVSYKTNDGYSNKKQIFDVKLTLKEMNFTESLTTTMGASTVTITDGFLRNQVLFIAIIVLGIMLAILVIIGAVLLWRRRKT